MSGIIRSGIIRENGNFWSTRKKSGIIREGVYARACARARARAARRGAVRRGAVRVRVRAGVRVRVTPPSINGINREKRTHSARTRKAAINRLLLLGKRGYTTHARTHAKILPFNFNLILFYPHLPLFYLILFLF